MSVSSTSGLRYNKKSHRPRRANRAPRRCRDGEELYFAVSLTGRFSSSLHFDLWFRHRFLVGDLQQFLCLGPEVAKLIVPWLVLLHRLDGFVEPLASFVLVVQLAVSHRHEEPVRAIAAVAEFHGLLQSD